MKYNPQAKQHSLAAFFYSQGFHGLGGDERTRVLINQSLSAVGIFENPSMRKPALICPWIWSSKVCPNLIAKSSLFF
jgi:hypothetical protein